MLALLICNNFFLALSKKNPQPFLTRVLGHLAAEEMQAVTCPALLHLREVETLTSSGGEKTGWNEMIADRMKTIETW